MSDTPDKTYTLPMPLPAVPTQTDAAMLKPSDDVEDAFSPPSVSPGLSGEALVSRYQPAAEEVSPYDLPAPAFLKSRKRSATEAANLWLANFTSPRTRDSYEKAVKLIVGDLGLERIEQLLAIDQRHVVAWRRHAEGQGLSARTINARLAALSSLFQSFQEQGFAVENPTRGVKRPKVRQDTVESVTISSEQVRKLLDAPDRSSLQGLRDRAILHVFAYTGCRVSEPGSLKVRDFGEEQGYGFLGFTVKGGKRNRVHLHPECTAAIKDYLYEAGHGAARDMPLFLQTKGAVTGKPMHRKSFELVFRRYKEETGLSRDVTPHSLRATFVTEALEKGCAVESVQRTVGHANIATTLMYDKRGQRPRDSASLAVRF